MDRGKLAPASTAMVTHEIRLPPPSVFTRPMAIGREVEIRPCYGYSKATFDELCKALRCTPEKLEAYLHGRPTDPSPTFEGLSRRHRPALDPLAVRTPKGMGLIAREPIPEGRLVGMYRGHLRSPARHLELDAGRDPLRADAFYDITIYGNDPLLGEQYWILDVDRDRPAPVARMSHSCRPNCKVVHFTRGGEHHIAIVTWKPIAPGHELTWNYRAVTDRREEASLCTCECVHCQTYYVQFREVKVDLSRVAGPFATAMDGSRLWPRETAWIQHRGVGIGILGAFGAADELPGWAQKWLAWELRRTSDASGLFPRIHQMRRYFLVLPSNVRRTPILRQLSREAAIARISRLLTLKTPDEARIRAKVQEASCPWPAWKRDLVRVYLGTRHFFEVDEVWRDMRALERPAEPMADGTVPFVYSPSWLLAVMISGEGGLEAKWDPFRNEAILPSAPSHPVTLEETYYRERDLFAPLLERTAVSGRKAWKDISIADISTALYGSPALDEHLGVENARDHVRTSFETAERRRAADLPGGSAPSPSKRLRRGSSEGEIASD